MQLKRTLEASFNRIDFYTSSIADVLGELSLYNRFSQLPTIGQDLGSLICDLDDSGLLSFLSRIADNCGVGTLYDELIATRFDSAMRCFGSVHSKPVSVSAIYNAIQLPKKYFYEQHSSLAYDIECGEEVNEKEYENLVVYGFVRRNSIRGDSSKRNLEFIHESIRYYFFARYFLMHDVESTYFNQYMKQYFLVSKAKRGAEFVDIFLNSCESLCKQFRSKIRRFLEQNPQQLATYIQYTLNNEAFKTLDVLLDEASMKAIKRLEFRFREIEASKKNNVSNDVNLVYVESNQLWRLLKVLVKEYPTDGDKRSSKLTLGLHPQQEVWGNITEGELETLLQDMTGESEDSEAAQLLDDVCNEALCVWNIGSEDWKACVEQRYGVTLAVAEVGVVKVMLMIMAGGFALCMLIIAEALADRKWNSWAAAGLYLLVKVTGVLVVTAYLVHEMKFNRKALRAIKIRHVETVARDSEKTPGL
ncbi:uncharacterized protein LOC126578100 isoform X1 [Anopheles aquasalis]|uniref:uncharacterized protein LOC126578100 isoform X1 n=1 Tax=Anopheles aquasalis TaxID=42839 RepID=UPI00215B0680|nr:uncharacterized protein LOC126578100 isoform X1 [Anopheles aquasalis]